MPLPPAPFVYPVLDAASLAGRSAGSVARALVEAGARIVQVRGKDLGDRALCRLVLEVVAAAHAGGAVVIVNDRPDVARITAADGVHVGQEDMDAGDVRRLLNAGADKVSINTAAVQNPELVREASGIVGNQCIVVAIDAKKRGDGWEVFTHGGRNATGLDAVDWARRMTEAGAGEILLTSMDRDGTRDGFDLALTRAVADA